VHASLTLLHPEFALRALLGLDYVLKKSHGQVIIYRIRVVHQISLVLYASLSCMHLSPAFQAVILFALVTPELIDVFLLDEHHLTPSSGTPAHVI